MGYSVGELGGCFQEEKSNNVARTPDTGGNTTVLLNLVDGMDWTTPLDIYCERVSTAFWGEPLNAISNLAFIFAVLWAWRQWRSFGMPARYSVSWLLFVLFSIGIGSFLYHTLANRWSLLADVIPILIFILSYFALVLKRVIGLNWLLTGLFLVVYLVAGAALQAVLPDNFLNGSAGYLPPYFMMIGFGFGRMVDC